MTYYIVHVELYMYGQTLIEIIMIQFLKTDKITLQMSETMNYKGRHIFNGQIIRTPISSHIN